ncbi:MAG: DoxX family protein [Micromonosporaceae bacterium]|nr:DoxX family protein [Micromonosporaceae bacterium]
MSTQQTPTPPARGRGANIAFWVLQGLLAAFFLLAAAGPKLVGEQTAVQMFDEIGAGQWFRHLVGVLEFAGAIGLVIPRLAGLAALGLVGVMAGATLTQLVVFGAPVFAITPVILGVLLGVVAWGRWPQTRALLAR